MAPPGGLPTLSWIENFTTAHLTQLDADFTRTANLWEDSFSQLASDMLRPGGHEWTGPSAEKAQDSTDSAQFTVRRASNQLRDAAGIARLGAQQLEGLHGKTVGEIGDARDAGFQVGEDLSVTDTRTSNTQEEQATRQAEAEAHAESIRSHATQLQALDSEYGAKVDAATAGLDNIKLDGAQGGAPATNGHHGVQFVDNMVPGPQQAGQAPDPTNPFIGDPRFGHWEDVPPPPPYTGPHPPPLQPQYRPYPDGTPQKVGPTTGMFTPGKTWIGDIDPPAVQGQEEYRFRKAGEQATTITRTVYDDGRWQQQRWVQNVYEYQRNTSLTFGGDVGVKGIEGEGGDLGGLPPIQNIDHTWKPISLPQIAALSAGNMDTTFYLPDGCGGTVNFVGGVPQGNSGLAPRPPIMTAPR